MTLGAIGGPNKKKSAFLQIRPTKNVDHWTSPNDLWGYLKPKNVNFFSSFLQLLVGLAFKKMQILVIGQLQMTFRGI